MFTVPDWKLEYLNYVSIWIALKLIDIPTFHKEDYIFGSSGHVTAKENNTKKQWTWNVFNHWFSIYSLSVSDKRNHNKLLNIC